MTFVKRAAEYADRVLCGDIPACKYTKLAAERFVRDLQRDDIYLDIHEAERWCSFLEKLPHTKGKWAAKKEKLRLSDYQIFGTVNIFGWRFKKNGRRRYRRVYIEVPRKNGKSLWIAGIGVGMLTIEGEYGAEIYCGATTEKQAWEVFRPAKNICEKTPALCDKYGIEINAKTINILSSGSRFEPVIGKPGDGASPSCGIVDEFHEHESPDLIDTLETGMGARDNPLLLAITTAGSDTSGPCYLMRDDLIKILTGTAEDDTFFGVIYGIDEDDDWACVESQKKANPNYGISVDPDFLLAQLEQARRSPLKQVSYKTKHLNMWVGAKSAWMNMLAYQACRKKDIDIDQYIGKTCYVGIDLASKKDIASMAIYFPAQEGLSHGAFFVRHFLPEETILDGGNTKYIGWHAGGWIVSTPGNIIDFSYIEDELIGLKSKFEIVEVAYDPFQATQFATRMYAEGFPMVECGQTRRNFSEPMKELEAMIISRSVYFTMCPVLMWMFGNVVAKINKTDDIFPEKDIPDNKIDGVVAIIMAVSRSIVDRDSGTPGDYELMVV